MNAAYAKAEVDFRLLWRDVAALVDATNKLMNMTFVIDARYKGIGHLQMAGDQAIARIYVGKST